MTNQWVTGMQRARVIAFSGVSGAGKTSVIKCLAEAFKSQTLLFDDFVEPNTYPEDMRAWLQEGADVSQIKSPRFTKALSELKAQCGSKVIFIEEPFGRQRAEIAHLIDYVIMLDMPMEVCLSRVIQRHLKHSNDPATTITNYLRKYDGHLRDVYMAAANQVRQSSDLIITNVDTIASIQSTISDWLHNNVK